MRRRWPRLALAALGVAAIALAAWQSPIFSGARERQVRRALFDELQPVALQNCNLTRFGGSHDTGYVMCKDLLEGIESAYSYGIVGDDDWGCELSMRYRVPVHQYDCLNPPRPACAEGRFVFHSECLGARRERVDVRWFNTLDRQIRDNGDGDKRLVVRIDVEGAEWDALMAAPDSVFEGIDQLPMEFHGVNESRFLRVVQKLKRHFHVANLYFNNHACSADAEPLPSSVYQVLFVNKRLGVIDPEEDRPLPSPQNAPDNPASPDCQPEVPDRAERQRALRAALLDELRPVALQNCTFARYGSTNDGGYLMCQNLVQDLGAAYSYGVGPNDEWGCDVSTRYRVPVHQYDCFDPARPSCGTGTFVFHNECLSDRTERVYGRTFDTLQNQIAANGDAGKRLIVKIDIEGAEWDAFMAMPESVLEGIDQMPMELHGVDEAKFVKALQKLKKQFYLVSLHFNNHSCSAALEPFPAWAFQVLLVNKRIGVLDPTKGTPPPNPLDAPDNPGGPDCQLTPAIPAP